MDKSKKRFTILSYVILTVLAIVVTIPFIWLVISAFNPAAARTFTIPETFNFENFKIAWSNPRTMQGFINSAFISIVQTAIVVTCSVLAAYPLSRYGLKLGNTISMAMLFLSAVPITAIMVPVFQLLVSLKLIDTYTGVILFSAAASLPYGIWMTKNFMDAVPMELEEAAWVDGTSRMGSMIKVVLPLMVPGLFTVTIFTFSGAWSNFFVPFILIQSTEKMPAAVNLQQFFGMNDTVQYGPLAAYSLVYILPCFILYFLAQNYMSKGFTMSGGTKG